MSYLCNGTGKGKKMERFVLSPEMTLSEWLAYWFETYAKRTIKQSTAISYRGYINNHITPQIGSYKLSELNTDILQCFFNYEYDYGNKRQNCSSGLSAKTLHNIKLMLHKALNKAVDNELIRRNFSDSVELPKVVEPDMRVLTVAEQQRLMSILKNTDEKYAMGIWISITTGLRIGEVLGLQWQDIDYSANKLYVRRTVNRLQCIDQTSDSGRRTEIVIGKPKSRKSIRDIPFNESFEETIKIYERSSRMKVIHIKPTDFVVTVNHNKPTEPKVMQECFQRVCECAGIKDATFHSLRHTFATRAIEKGVDVKTLSVLLGHADVSTTLNRYAHVLDEQKRKTMDILLADIM